MTEAEKEQRLMATRLFRRYDKKGDIKELARILDVKAGSVRMWKFMGRLPGWVMEPAQALLEGRPIRGVSGGEKKG